jgi:transposase-like protein
MFDTKTECPHCETRQKVTSGPNTCTECRKHFALVDGETLTKK